MMRGRLTALLCYFATLAVIVAVGAGWVAVNVQSEAGFTDLASQIGDDPQVQDVSAELAGEAFADQAGLPSVTRGAVARTVTRSIERLTRNDGWSPAWRETMRRSHERLFAEPSPTDIRVDVAPLVDVALDEATTRLPVDLTGPQELLVTVSEDDPGQLLEFVSHARPVALSTAIIAAVAALLALVMAPQRGAALAGLGLGALAAAGFWWAVGHLVVPRVVEDRAGATTYGRELHEAVTEHVAAALDSTLLWVALAGAAMIAVGLVSRALRS